VVVAVLYCMLNTEYYPLLMQGRQDELIISMVIKPSNQLKITFLEAKDITDLGTLKASKIVVPGYMSCMDKI